MKTFRCACGAEVYFENVRCLACDRTLGYLPDQLRLAALEPLEGNLFAVADDEESGPYRMCRHYFHDDACNWMVPAADPETFCTACRLNEIIPNLDKPGNRNRWIRIEQRKRRLIHDLLRRKLPVKSRKEEPGRGLGFAFLEDNPGGLEFQADLQSGQVLTGHANGLITINIAEADDVQRERMRVQMNEHQRTLLGHFRHESGHYYWQRLLIDDAQVDAVRELFGDERADYGSALDTYYNNGPPADWQGRFVSAYASAHPWEDWAECWGHLLQITDTLETAAAIGLVDEELVADDLESRIGSWIELSIKLNTLSRSLDQPDPYPYVLSPEVVDKLLMVDRVIRRGVAAG